jgi:hypothetical protein
MPIATTIPLVKAFIFNDIASPKAIASGSYRPDDGHYAIIPIAAGTDTSVEFNSVHLYDSGKTATDYSLLISADPTGALVLWHGSGSYVDTDNSHRVVWTPNVRVSNGFPDAITNLTSTDQGRFYLLFKCNANASGSAVYGTYSILDHNV